MSFYELCRAYWWTIEDEEVQFNVSPYSLDSNLFFFDFCVYDRKLCFFLLRCYVSMYPPLMSKKMLALSMSSKEGNLRLMHVHSSIDAITKNKMQISKL